MWVKTIHQPIPPEMVKKAEKLWYFSVYSCQTCTFKGGYVYVIYSDMVLEIEEEVYREFYGDPEEQGFVCQ